MKSLWIVVFVCLTAVAGAVRPAAAAEPLERLVPEETIGFGSVGNVADLTTKVEALPLYKVLAEKGFIEGLLPAEAYDEVKAFYEKYVRPLGEVFKGQVAAAFIDVDMEGMEAPKFVALADVSTTGPALQKYLDDVIYPWLDANEDLDRKTATVAGTTFTQVVSWDEPTGAFGVKDGTAFFFPDYGGVDAFLEALEKPPSKSLADNKWFVRAKEALAGADVFEYFNLGVIDRRSHQQMIEDEWEEEYDETWGVFHAISGFKMLEVIAQGYTFGSDSCESKLCCLGDGPDGGIFEVLARKAPALKSTEYVAGDAALYAALSLGDASFVYEQLMAIVDQMDSYDAEGVQDAIAVLEQVLDKEMETEILPAFGGEAALVAWVPDGLSVPPAALMIEVKDKAAVGEMVDRVLGLLEDESGGEIELEKDEAEGVTVTLIHGVPMVTPAVGVVGDFLVVATDAAVIGRMVDTLHDGGTLSETAGYKKYVASIEGDATITLYVDTPSIAKVGLPLLRGYLEGEEGAKVFGAIEKLAGALSPAGMKVVGGQDGITITSRSDNGGLGPVGLLAGFGTLGLRAASVEFEGDEGMIFEDDEDDEDDEAVWPDDDESDVGDDEPGA